MSEIRPLLLPPKLLRCQIVLVLCLLGLALVAAPALAQDETPQPRAGDAPGTAAGCSELLVNGGFEVEGLGWQALLPGLPETLDADYVVSPVFAGSRAIRLGIVEAENTTLTNGIFQVVTLPADANPIALSVQLLPKHESNPGTDLQFIDIHDALTNDLIVRLWSQTTDRASWLFQQFDLTSLRGRTVRISVGVNNDGIGGRTALFVDSMSLQACDSVPVPTPTPTSPVVVPTILVTPTPTPTDIWVIVTQTATPIVWTPTPVVWTPTPIIWTPTPQPPTATSTPILPPTPLPAGCITNVIMNGSFEDDIVGSTGWILGDDPIPPRLVSGGFVGLRALQLGNPAEGGRTDVYSYSSARQLITIPHTAKTAELFWAHRSFTQDNGEPRFGNRVDRQELILLSPDLVTLETPRYRTLLNSNGWRIERTDLTSYIGKTFYIYFNVLNDGDNLRTWMDLDDVKLTLCFSVTPAPVMTIPAQVSPLGTPLIATLTPTGIDANVTRTIIEVTEVSISGESSERTLEGDILEEVAQEQETLTQRLQQIVAQYWWLGVIVVGLWAIWGFFGRKP